MTAALAPSPRHPWESLLAQLCDRSGLVHGWGEEDDAKRAPLDHVTWVPGAPTFEKPPFKIAGTVVAELLAVEHDVFIYGGSPAVALMRAKDLVGQLDLLAGPRQGNPATTPPRPGFNVRAKGKPVKGGELAAGNWLVTLVVTLKDFSYRQINGSGVVAPHVDISTTVLNPDGTTPAGDPLNPLQASA